MAQTVPGTLRVSNDCIGDLAGYAALECYGIVGMAFIDANAGVTRYDGAGWNVLDAALAAERSALPLIPEYEGGPGCGSGTGECHEHDH